MAQIENEGDLVLNPSICGSHAEATLEAHEPLVCVPAYDPRHNHVTWIHYIYIYIYIAVGTVGQSNSLAATDTENRLARKSSKPRLVCQTSKAVLAHMG